MTNSHFSLVGDHIIVESWNHKGSLFRYGMGVSDTSKTSNTMVLPLSVLLFSAHLSAIVQKTI